MPAKCLVACLAIAATAGCARKQYSPSAQDFSDASAAGAVPRDHDVISRDELQSPSLVGLTVLEAVRTLRPQFLSVRGNNAIVLKGMADTEAGKVHSSIDGAKVGPLDDLSMLRASTEKEIRFLNAAAAHHRFGGAAREGPVILVTVL